MAAIVGAAGLRSTLAAAGAGKRLMVANKEAVVMAGRLVLEAAERSGAQVIPIDSEHNAIFQCLPPAGALGTAPAGVRRILLTASGGPFRDWSAAALQDATPEQACAHPTWNMGRKISVDSATLMNKGLELIEASGCSAWPRRSDRGGHPSAERHPFPGGIRRRFGACTAGLPGHAHTDRPGTCVAAATGRRCTIPRSVQVARLDFEAPDFGVPVPGLALDAARGRQGAGSAECCQ